MWRGKELKRLAPGLFIIVLAWEQFPVIAETTKAKTSAGLQKSDAQKQPFVGDKTIIITGSCGPGGCHRRCQQECEAAVGEKCDSFLDACDRCLQQHQISPKEAREREERMGGMLLGSQQMCAWCREKYPEVFTESRCTFGTSEDVQVGLGTPPLKGVTCHFTCR